MRAPVTADRTTGGSRRRSAFTLIEMMVAMTLLMFIMGTAVQYMRKQGLLVSTETVRSDTFQSAEFAVSQLDRELRAAGAGVADIQPMLAQVDTQSITFNANVVSIDSGDVRAVYQLRDADTNGARGMFFSEAVTLPNSNPAKLYPDTTYYAASGITSSAETISYYLRPDSTGTISGRYLLMRRVNALPPTLIARGIVKDSRDTVPFLTYFVQDTLNKLVSVARTRLPFYHVKVHGDVADTGKSGATDSIKAVRIHVTMAARDQRTGKDNLRTVESLVRLMNSGLLDRTTCGQPPYGVATPTVAASSSPKKVTISWTRSSDEGGGEKDVERYAIFRRLSSASAFGDPITSIPAGQTNYSFIDTNVITGNTYIYGIAAQDCSPQLSGVNASLAVTVP
jgi:prepilin-type N-terminal cleavage/methylation domain-containing protein